MTNGNDSPEFQALAGRVAAIEESRQTENLSERVQTLETGQSPTQNLTARIGALEIAQPAIQTLIARIEAMETAVNLTGRIGALEAAQAANQNLAARVGALELAQPPFTQQQTLAHEHAANWLRMVNTNIWTLNSIFLVGSVIALSNAHSNSDLAWKHSAGWIVFVMSLVWLAFDISYSVSARRARKILERLENRFAPEEQLYLWQTSGKQQVVFWLAIVASYVTITGILCLSVWQFILAR